MQQRITDYRQFHFVSIHSFYFISFSFVSFFSLIVAYNECGCIKCSTHRTANDRTKYIKRNCEKKNNIEINIFAFAFVVLCKSAHARNETAAKSDLICTVNVSTLDALLPISLTFSATAKSEHRTIRKSDLIWCAIVVI